MKYSESTIDECRIIHLPKIQNEKGNLTPVENGSLIPFDIRRIYYLYDVPGGETRGGHAHIYLQQFLTSVSGSFDVILDDGCRRKTVKLNRAHMGLYIPRGIWREIVNFSTGAICLALASLPYSESEYVRNYEDFVLIKKQMQNGTEFYD